jgi:two-component system, cell cycle sensor histidine kinase and response regulator CckA
MLLLILVFVRADGGKKENVRMKLSTITKLTAVLALCLAIVAAHAIISYSRTVKVMHDQKWVTHSHEVIIQLEKTLSTLKGTESDQRTYLLLSDEYYLEKYNQTKQETRINLEKLKLLALGDSQKQQFSLLNKKIIQRLNILDEELTLESPLIRRNTDNSVLYRKEKQIVFDIQEIIRKLEEKEQKKLDEQIIDSQNAASNTLITFIIAVVGDLLLLALLYYLLRRYILRLKQAKSELRQSENRLRVMIDAEPECVKLIATDGTLLEINTSGLEMLEVETPEEVIGKSVFAGVLPEYQQAFRQLHNSVCQGNKEVLEFEIIGNRGTHRWMETHAVPLWNEVDKSFLHLAVTRDVTKRKRQEIKIREQAALLSIATDAIMVQDLERNILFWNKGAETLYGWRISEVLDQNISQILYKKDVSPEITEVLCNVLEYGSWQGELNQIKKDGTPIIVQSSWTLVQDDNGRPKSILSVNTEITQKKKFEAQLLRSQRLESIGTLAGGIAHDLNNILTPILMSVQLLQIKLKDDQSQELLKTLENNAKRGANLVKQVLSFARGVETKQSLIQINHLIREIEQIIKQTFPKSISCHLNMPDNLWYVSGDITQLHQVLMNLVVNANDAMPDGGNLSIFVENTIIDQHYAQMNVDAKEGSYLVISVVDDGVGMSPEVQERIFEPFFTTKEVGKGTGLGLATTLGIIKKHNGFVSVYSEISKGTKFKIYLPAVEIKPEMSKIGDRFNNATDHVMVNGIKQKLYPTAETTSQERKPQIGNGELILVVDDEKGIRETSKSYLELYDYRVIVASDGIEAVSLYADHRSEISLILLDMMMPSMSGTMAIRTLEKINPDVKIIATSGLPSNQKLADDSSTVVKAFLLKPYTAQELLESIKTVINTEYKAI